MFTQGGTGWDGGLSQSKGLQRIGVGGWRCHCSDAHFFRCMLGKDVVILYSHHHDVTAAYYSAAVSFCVLWQGDMCSQLLLNNWRPLFTQQFKDICSQWLPGWRFSIASVADVNFSGGRSSSCDLLSTFDLPHHLSHVHWIQKSTVVASV